MDSHSVSCSTWTVVQLKAWLRENAPFCPVSGTKAELSSKVESLMKTQQAAASSNAQEYLLVAPEPPRWENLPASDSCCWTSTVEDFPSVSSELTENYLKGFGGYSKNWATGCQLITDGHVSGLHCHSTTTSSVSHVKAKVKARMKSRFYNVFIILSRSDEKAQCVDSLLGGLCECEAGKSQSCIHVAATLIMLAHLTEDPSTSLPCLWRKPSSRSAQHATFAMELDLGKVDKVKNWSGQPPDPLLLMEMLQEADIETSWSKFQKIDETNLQKQSAAVNIPTLNNPVHILHSIAEGKGVSSLCVADLISALSADFQEIRLIEELTRGQSATELWHQARSLRLTASNFGLICRPRKGSIPPSVLSRVTGDCDISHVPAIRYGRQMEYRAIQQYKSRFPASQVSPCGFFIYKDMPFIGASPDGIILSEDGEGCLEVKCSYSHQHETIEDAASSGNFFLETTSEGIFLRRSHNYYFQVIGQMGVTGLKWSHFVVYTHKSLHVEKIRFDEECWQDMCVKLKDTYRDVFGPEFLKRLVNS